jgi:hypothetical protein
MARVACRFFLKRKRLHATLHHVRVRVNSGVQRKVAGKRPKYHRTPTRRIPKRYTENRSELNQFRGSRSTSDMCDQDREHWDPLLYQSALLFAIVCCPAAFLSPLWHVVWCGSFGSPHLIAALSVETCLKEANRAYAASNCQNASMIAMKSLKIYCSASDAS